MLMFTVGLPTNWENSLYSSVTFPALMPLTGMPFSTVGSPTKLMFSVPPPVIVTSPPSWVRMAPVYLKVPGRSKFMVSVLPGRICRSMPFRKLYSRQWLPLMVVSSCTKTSTVPYELTDCRSIHAPSRLPFKYRLLPYMYATYSPLVLKSWVSSSGTSYTVAPTLHSLIYW